MEPSTTETEVKITVVLVSKAAADLAKTRRRSRLNQADVVNRAISFYEFVDEELDNGTALMLRRRDGSTYLVELH
jgi:hypothetical protein